MTRGMAETLAANQLFRDLPATELRVLAERARTVKFSTGQVIFETGDASDALYAVLSGRVRIVRRSPDGDEVTISLMDPGEIFGEIAVLDGRPRSAGAMALEKTRLGMIRRADFHDFLRDHPEASIGLLRMLCQRLRNTTEQVDTIAFRAVEARLARLLVRLAEDYGSAAEGGVMIDLRLGQRELGAFIATSRESVSRQLKEWRAERLVERVGGRLRILDLEAIKALAQLDPE